MEQKLDGLVALLSASHAQAQPSAPTKLEPIIESNSSAPDIASSDGFIPNEATFLSVILLNDEPSKGLCSEPAAHAEGLREPGKGDPWLTTRCHTPPKQGTRHVQNLDDAVATVLLENYQASMARHFPFVIIPLGTTAQDLRASKPFLFLSLMAVSSYQRSGQKTTLSIDVVRRLGEQMLFRGEKSLDLLQGLLVYAEWSVLTFAHVATLSPSFMKPASLTSSHRIGIIRTSLWIRS